MNASVICIISIKVFVIYNNKIAGFFTRFLLKIKKALSYWIVKQCFFNMPIMPLSFICLDLRVQVGILDFSFAIRSETIQHP